MTLSTKTLKVSAGFLLRSMGLVDDNGRVARVVAAFEAIEGGVEMVTLETCRALVASHAKAIRSMASAHAEGDEILESTARYLDRLAAAIGDMALVKVKSRLSEVTAARCNIPALTLPPCDMEWGHGGDQHANAGDGFFARDHDREHHARQNMRRAALPDCDWCNGDGVRNYSDDFGDHEITCSDCNGTGKEGHDKALCDCGACENWRAAEASHREDADPDADPSNDAPGGEGRGVASGADEEVSPEPMVSDGQVSLNACEECGGTGNSPRECEACNGSGSRMERP